MALGRVFVELAPAVLALDPIVPIKFLLHLHLHLPISSAHAATARHSAPSMHVAATAIVPSSAKTLPQLHALKFPLWNRALLGFSFGWLALCLPSRVGILINALPASISGLPLFFNVEFLSLFNENLTADLLMLLDPIGCELAPAIVAWNEPANLTILFRLVVVRCASRVGRSLIVIVAFLLLVSIILLGPWLLLLRSRLPTERFLLRWRLALLDLLFHLHGWLVSYRLVLSRAIRYWRLLRNKGILFAIERLRRLLMRCVLLGRLGS